MSANTNLHKAKLEKNDEFYTQLSDIENELRHYRSLFKGKVVYCNCDDPHVSNFFHYFSLNFELLGLKKLVTTCYQNRRPDTFSRHDSERAIMLEYEGFREGERVPKVEDIGVKELSGDGDFRSSECIDLLKQADIIVTNPPFSLFREYIGQLIEYDKKFLIIGSKNAITYQEIFPLIQNNQMWLGNSSGDMEFQVPDHYPAKKFRYRMSEEGQKFYSLGNANWFTNLDHPKRHEQLILYKQYSPIDYPHYDNYDAINVDKVDDIPMDWEGVMGVPITYLDQHNPEQFEILGFMANTRVDEYSFGYPYVDGKRKYARIVIRKKEPNS